MANKGFTIGPSSSTFGLPQEILGAADGKAPDASRTMPKEGAPAAAELTRALQRQIVTDGIIRQGHNTETSIDKVLFLLLLSLSF